MDTDIPLSPKRRLLHDLFLPVIIIIAGLIIAMSVYAVRIREYVTHGTGTPEAVRPVSPTDHIIGDPSAPIVIIEYADTDSAYGKKLQLTMEQLMTEYASGKKVAWVYRHFPVTTLHPNAGLNALASECAASLGGPLTFFRFIDTMQSLAPDTAEFNPKQYGVVLKQLSLPEEPFNTCMSAQTFEPKIRDDYNNALASGATASPYIVLSVQGQKPKSIQGAPPYKTLKAIIEKEIASLPK